MSLQKATRGLLLGACTLLQPNPHWSEKVLREAVEVIDPSIENQVAHFRVRLAGSPYPWEARIKLDKNNQPQTFRVSQERKVFIDQELDGGLDTRDHLEEGIYWQVLTVLSDLSDFERVKPGSVCHKERLQNPHIFDAALKATARIYPKSRAEVVCSAYFVASGLLVTASHCYLDENTRMAHTSDNIYIVEWPEIEPNTGEIVRIYQAEAEGIFLAEERYSLESDIGLLGMSVYIKNQPRPLDLAGELDLRGPYGLVGHPYGASWVVSTAERIVQAKPTDAALDFHLNLLEPEPDCVTGPGVSGGPMVANGLAKGTTLIMYEKKGDLTFVALSSNATNTMVRDFGPFLDPVRYPRDSSTKLQEFSTACQVENHGVFIDAVGRRIYENAKAIDCQKVENDKLQEVLPFFQAFPQTRSETIEDFY